YEERYQRRADEPDHRLTANAADRLGVAHVRHADHEGREHERRDDHFNKSQEDVGEQRDVIGDSLCRFRIRPQNVTGVTDENTQHHADENNRGEFRTHGLPPALCQISSLAETTPHDHEGPRQRSSSAATTEHSYWITSSAGASSMER